MTDRFLFLDFDGVLNNANWRSPHKLSAGAELWTAGQLDPANVAQLERIAVSVPDVMIIISSSWRKLHSLAELRHYLTLTGAPTAAGLVFDKTGNSNSGHRGFEINQWLEANAHGDHRFVILDDDTDMMDHQLPHFIHTDAAVGLTAEQADKAIAMLMD